MPTPASNSGVSPGLTSRAPDSAASFPACRWASSRVSPVSTARPPHASTAAALAGLAFAGMTTVHGASCRRLAYAIDCAWFPVDQVTVPRARSAAGMASSRVSPPRTLNAPTGCVFSCLTSTFAPVARSSSG